MNEYIIVLIDKQTDQKYFQNFNSFNEMIDNFNHLVRMSNIFCTKTRFEFDQTVTVYSINNFLRESYVELALLCGENERLRRAFEIPLTAVNQ